MKLHRGARSATTGAMTAQGSDSLAVVSIGKSRASYVGPSLRLSEHRNAVATIAVGIEKPFMLRMPDAPGSGATTVESRIAVIPPGTLHHVAGDGLMAFIYVDAFGDDWRAISTSGHLAHGLPVIESLADPLPVDADAWTALLGVPARDEPDARLQFALATLDADLDRFARIADLATEIGLSASHAQALLRKTTGVPFRRYRLWRRMAKAAEAIAEGGTLTEAAHLAGFASSAHFSAAFRGMFGLQPSLLLARRVAIRCASAVSKSVAADGSGRRIDSRAVLP